MKDMKDMKNMEEELIELPVMQQFGKIPLAEIRVSWNKYCKLNGLDIYMVDEMGESNDLMPKSH